MIHGGSSRRREKLAQMAQTGAQGVGPGNSDGPSVTATSNNGEGSPELGANLVTDDYKKLGAIALGAGVAIAALN